MKYHKANQIIFLYQMHTLESNHPSKTQMKPQFKRRFHALNIDTYLDLHYDNCFNCSVLQRLPRIPVNQDIKAVVEHLLKYFHTDVFKRAGQNIMLLTEHPQR